MTRYVQITQSDMDAFMEAVGLEELSVEERGSVGRRPVKERVYESSVIGPMGGRIRVYSSVVGPEARDKGKDAIRVQYWINDRKVYGAKRVNRTENWRANVLERINDVYEMAESGALSRVPKDSRGDYMVARRSRGRRKGNAGYFWGSANYPEIRETRRFAAASVAPFEPKSFMDRVMMTKYLMDDAEKQETIMKIQYGLKTGILSQEDVLEMLSAESSGSTIDKMTTRERKQAVLLALSNRRWMGRYDAPYEMTSHGIGEAIGKTRTGVEKTAKELIAEGLVVREKRHVREFPKQKVWTYQITAEGQRAVNEGMFAAEGRYRVGTKGQGGYSYTPLEEPCPVCGKNEENVLMIYRDDGTIETACVRGDCDMHMVLMKPKSRSGLLGKLKNLFSSEEEEEREFCNWCKETLSETRPEERANGEQVCRPCYEAWMEEYRNDLDMHYSPFYAETFEAQFKPPASAVANAKRGLKLRKEYGRGGLSPSEAAAQGIDSGVTRAKRIASGTVSTHDVRRMSAFNRHRKNYRPEKKMPDGGPTAGTIAWLLWGGTSGVNWAKKKSAAMNAETFEAYDVASWNPADEPSEEEAVWEQFYEYCPDKDLIAKLWDLEGQPGDSAESWMDSLEGTDEHENVFERHYQLIKEAAYRYWDEMHDAMSQQWEDEREAREEYEEKIARLMEDPEYTTMMDSEEKTRTTIYFPDGSTMETRTDYTIEEHRKLAKPHNEHYDYLKYLETTSDSRIKTFKEWLMYEISKDYNEYFSAEEVSPFRKAKVLDIIIDWHRRNQLQSETIAYNLDRIHWLLENPDQDWEDYDDLTEDDFSAETRPDVVSDGCPVCETELSEVSETVLRCDRCEIAWDLIVDEEGFEYLDSESDDSEDYGVGPTWM